MVWDDDNDFGARLKRRGYWTALQHRQMDAQFCAAMEAAGFILTPCSTVRGTRAPLTGYRHD